MRIKSYLFKNVDFVINNVKGVQMREKQLRIMNILGLIFLLFLSPLIYSQTSIFTTQVPINSGNDGDYELGLKFNSTQMAQISAIRFYKMPGEGSVHTATLWTNTGTALATANVSNETASGWQYATFSQPITISANTEYIASVSLTSVYAIEQHQLDNSITNEFLTAAASGGVFNETPGQFPTQAYQNSNYFVDVVATSLNSIFTTQTPAGEFNDGPYEMGVKFTTSQTAKVKMFSYYKVVGESGTHIGNLWNETGTLLVTAMFTNETSSGWQYAPLSSDVYLTTGNTYVVSVNSNTAYGAGAAQSLAASVTNGILSTVADGNNGVFSGNPNTQGLFPTFSFNNNNYFRDIIVEPIFPPAVPSLTSPADLTEEISIEPMLNWSSIVGATYTLQVATDLTFNNMIINQSGLTSASFSLSGLSNSTEYFWRVSAEKDFLTSGFSSTSKFTSISNSQVLLSWPIGGASLYASPVSFYWYVPSGGLGWQYDLLYSTDINMTAPTVLENLSSAPYNLSGLQPGITYYWKVRLKAATGAVVSYSDKESFITFGKALVPVPSTPIDDITVYSLSPTLYWYLNDGSTNLTYEVELREGTPAALTNIATSSNLTSHNLVAADLQSGKQYSWHVRSKSGTLYSDWSDAVSFFTVVVNAPVIPIASWPVGSAIVYTTSPSLYWYLNSSSVGLVFEVEFVEGLATSFTGIPNITGIASLATTLSNLIPGSDYKWRVRSTDGSSTSDWSTTEIFSVVPSVANNPIAPTPSWPVGGATVYSTSAQLNWYLDLYRTGLTYDVELRAGLLNGTPTIASITSTNSTVTNLTPGTTYFWHVRSSNGSTNSDWSATESFQTISAPVNATVPILSWPIGGATVYTNSPLLSWYLNSPSAGITYELQYGLSSNMSGATTVSGLASNQINLIELTEAAIYYWRVRSFDGIVYSSFSATESFGTFGGSNAFVIPVAVSPAEGISIQSSSAMLSWFLPAKSDVAGYEVQYANNAEMQNATELKMNSTSQMINNLESGKTYFWRVRSVNTKDEVSSYSRIEKFIPTSTTGITDQPELPTAFQLKQNFPNPFNPTTVLEFSIPVDGFYTLDVYNLLGEKVSSLVSEMLTPGVYKAHFNGSNLSSGVYFYRLSGANVNLVRKMMLTK